MANTNAPFGLQYVGSQQANTVSGAARTYTVPATDSTAIYIGDLGTHKGTASAGTDGKIRPVIGQSAASDKVTGVVIGFDGSRDNENFVYRKASTLRDVRVIDDPYGLYEIQCSNGALTADMIGLNADIAVGTGSTTTGVSGMTLDVGTVATTATLPLRIVGLSERANNALGEYAVVICTLNYTTYKDTTGV